jgi:hypothetical protein
MFRSWRRALKINDVEIPSQTQVNVYGAQTIVTPAIAMWAILLLPLLYSDLSSREKPMTPVPQHVGRRTALNLGLWLGPMKLLSVLSWKSTRRHTTFFLSLLGGHMSGRGCLSSEWAGWLKEKQVCWFISWMMRFGLQEQIVFESPVQSGIFTFFGRTETATGCLVWKYEKNGTETAKNRQKPVRTGSNWFFAVSVITSSNWLKLTKTECFSSQNYSM